MFIKEYKGIKKRATLLCTLLIIGMLVACGQEQGSEDAQTYHTIAEEDITTGDTSVNHDESSNLKDSIAENSTEKNEEYQSYQEAYLAIIKSSEIEGMDEEYNLIYFDDNDVPELVVSKNDYYVSLYTYDDGSVFQLMDKWPYGAMGNAGYEYAPRQNSLRNYNTDYAGAILYTTYAAISEQYSIDVVAEIKFVNFDDVNQNGMPDENEEGSIGYYGVSYLNGVEATHEECAAYDKGEYEYIQGVMSVEELREKLVQDEQLQVTENVHVGEVIDVDENKVESIQDEIAKVEAMSQEHCNIDSSSMSQQDMNIHSAQWYKIWDDELNSLWSRLSDELDAETKAQVLEEQRAWIKRKEGNATAAGVQALGGSLQPLLESETAAEMTRARVYVLAGYLAEVRNESFTISTDIQESLDKADPSLDDVFAQFEGQWIFDGSRGACVGVERTEHCTYAVEGSNWTIWVTGGGIFSDLDVYGYTENNILFKIPHNDFDAFYELSFGADYKLILTYTTSLSPDAINDCDVIVCE